MLLPRNNRAFANFFGLRRFPQFHSTETWFPREKFSVSLGNPVLYFFPSYAQRRLLLPWQLVRGCCRVFHRCEPLVMSRSSLPRGTKAKLRRGFVRRASQTHDRHFERCFDWHCRTPPTRCLLAEIGSCKELGNYFRYLFFSCFLCQVWEVFRCWVYDRYINPRQLLPTKTTKTNIS